MDDVLVYFQTENRGGFPVTYLMHNLGKKKTSQISHSGTVEAERHWTPDQKVVSSIPSTAKLSLLVP